MKRLLPSPLLALVLLTTWLMLGNTLAPGQILLGAGLALAIPLLSASLRPAAAERRAGRRRWRPAAVLLGRLLADIVVANLQVARRVLGAEARLSPCFIDFELTLQSPTAVAMLAAIVSLTPGTISADLSADRRHLLIHALDAPDPAAVVVAIRGRYEALLAELFA